MFEGLPIIKGIFAKRISSPKDPAASSPLRSSSPVGVELVLVNNGVVMIYPRVWDWEILKVRGRFTIDVAIRAFKELIQEID